MKIADRVRQASFLRRENRFACLVKLGGSIETAHLASSGRLETVLTPGRTVFVAEKLSPKRATKWDLVTASVGDGYVSLDDRVPMRLVNEALAQKALPQFAQYSSIRQEVPRGRSRLDFLLGSRTAECFLEVKSVTLVRKSVALFPDTPTERGRLHVESLVWAKKEGYEVAMVFVVQRDDAEGFSPNDEVDPEFCRALRLALIKGLSIYAYKCRVKPNEIELAGQLPVRL